MIQRPVRQQEKATPNEPPPPELATQIGHMRRIYTLASSLDSARLVSSSRDRGNAYAFRSNGAVLATASDDGSVRLWKVPSL